MSEVKIYCAFISYPNPVKQSLRNLERIGALSVAFTHEKEKTMKQKFTRQLVIDSKFFPYALANPCKM
jgi:hypothetical protein